jgi:hypothetical protein
MIAQILALVALENRQLLTDVPSVQESHAHRSAGCQQSSRQLISVGTSQAPSNLIDQYQDFFQRLACLSI